jgi:hypothetical protein
MTAVSLRISSLPKVHGDPWIVDSLNWLECAECPVPAETIRTLVIAGYTDQFGIIDRGELIEWLDRARTASTTQLVYRLPDWQRNIARTFQDLTEKLSRDSVGGAYLLHWYEWESGLE